jgi:hypothetical protein
MQYLLLIYGNEKEFDATPKAQVEENMRAYLALTTEMKEKRQYVGGNRLAPATTATTVRVREGKRLVTDGPFAETKEQLGGYYLVEARDLDEAIALAAKIPGARFGSIEVRPIMQMPSHQP